MLARDLIGFCFNLYHQRIFFRCSANRGEIAARIIRTCREIGIPTVALYSVADGPGALHAKMADESYLIGSGPEATASYLLQDEILQIAQQSGAQAIHPGYGFLSENANFCQRVSDTPGLTFVGPGPAAITAMGAF
jgi:acetyl/propionyl-CoA carboxylase alpha subunit